MERANKRTTAALIGSLAVVSGGVQAAGFGVLEQSVKGLGTAFASGTAAGEDASTVFFNPAAMVKIQGDQLLFGAHTYIPNVDFRDGGSRLSAVGRGARLRGIDAENGGEVGLIPNFYYMHSYSDRLKYGVGITTPFALGTTYNLGWAGRYHADRSELLTINFNPSVAYRVNDFFSVGVGFNLQYLDVTTTNAIDASGVCLRAAAVGRLPAVACQQAGLVTPGNPGTDGYTKLIGNSYSFGYNIGFLFEPLPTTRIGLHYRSHINQDVEGDATFTMPALLKAGGAFQNTGAKTSIETPSSASISAYHDLTPEWAIMGDVTWTHWSSFKEIRILFDNPRQPPGVTPENWGDTFRFAIGTTYRPTGQPYVLRAGFAHEETPIPDAEHRTPRIPDADRRWLSFGGSYRLTPSVSIDAAYAHLFVDDAPINNVETVTEHRLAGEFGVDIDLFSVQLDWRPR